MLPNKNLYAGLHERRSQFLVDESQLVSQASHATAMSTSQTISFVELLDRDKLERRIDRELNPPRRFIYAIFHINSDKWSDILTEMKSAKCSKRNSRSYSRINADHAASKRHCMYVGSSKKGSSRFKQHMGFRAPGTYALQLLHWARPELGGIRIDVLEVGDGVSDRSMLHLEDQLWFELKPLFGRRGSV